MIDPRIIDEAYKELSAQSLNESDTTPVAANNPIKEKRDPKIERIKKLVNDISSLLYKLEDNPYDAEFGKEDDDLRDEMKKLASKTIVKMVNRLKDIIEDDIDKSKKDDKDESDSDDKKSKKDDKDESDSDDKKSKKDDKDESDSDDKKKDEEDVKPEGQFEIYKDKVGKFRFRLKTEKGETIMSSEAYESKQALKKAIDSVIENVSDQTTDDKDDKKENQMPKLFPTESIVSPQGKEYIILEVNKKKSLVRDALIGETFKINNDILKKWKNS